MEKQRNATRESIQAIPELIRRLYAIVSELETAFPGRHFTPDGHLLGSLGEVLAAYHYGLTLLTASADAHDAKSPDGRLVQIKATQIGRVSLRGACNLLLVLKLDTKGGFEEIYNGPGELVWQAVGKLQKNGQRAIGLSKLRKLNSCVTNSQRLPRIAWS